MRKALKRRFVISAMASFLILVILLIGSIVVINYHQMERMSDEFLAEILNRDTRIMQGAPPNLFGYQFTRESFPAGFCTIRTNAAGEIVFMEQIGLVNDREDIVRLVREITADDQTEGKTGAYKYRAAYAKDGSARLILMDQTHQITALYNVLKTGALVGAACLMVLFIILQPVAAYLSGAWLSKTEQQKQFITNAGHELKTPVAIIMSNVDALELISGENKYSRNIQQQTRRLDKLIKQLLMIARVDELRYRDQFESVDFSQLLSNDTSAFQEPARVKTIQMQTSIAPNCTLRGHRESLRQLIYVLMDNAVQYGKEGGTIRLTLQKSSRRRIELAISNDVETLPSCQPQELFQRFYRTDQSRVSAKAGCGVGLSAAETIVKLHKGTISISYPDDQTFCVRMTFPSKA